MKADQRQRGRYLEDIIPFGKRVGDEGDLVDVREEQAAIIGIQEPRASGASLRAIATEMKAQGHNLSHEAVRAILAR
jgi:hypothetical protein